MLCNEKERESTRECSKRGEEKRREEKRKWKFGE
jgi:hypothetical protein